MIRSRRRRRCAAGLVLALVTASAAAAGGRPFFTALVPGADALVLASREGPIQLLSVPGLDPVRQLTSPDGSPLEGIAVAGNGRWLAASSFGGSLWVWDLRTGERRFAVPRPEPDAGLSYLFHPTADLLYVAAGGALEIWDAAAGSRSGFVDPVRAVERMSISPDGRYLVVAGSCRTGCGRFDLCVYGFSESLVLAGRSFEGLLGESQDEIVDLVYSPDHEIVVWNSLRFDDGRRRTRASAATLRELESVHYASIGERPVTPGIRSAPSTRFEDRDPEELWKVSLSPERGRLYLFRLQGGGEPVLEKFLRLD